MNTEDFKKIVKNVVQEELKRQLPALIPQILSEILSGKSSAVITEMESPKDVKKPAIIQKTTPKPEKEYKKYTNNPLLNDILNETTIKIKQDNYYASPTHPVLADNSSGFDIKDDGIVNFGELMESKSPQTPIVADITPATEEQAKVLGKLNRDFRGLMKAIEDKKHRGVV